MIATGFLVSRRWVFTTLNFHATFYMRLFFTIAFKFHISLKFIFTLSISLPVDGGPGLQNLQVEVLVYGLAPVIRQHSYLYLAMTFCAHLSAENKAMYHLIRFFPDVIHCPSFCDIHHHYHSMSALWMKFSNPFFNFTSTF